MFYVDDEKKANFMMDYEFPLIVHETYLKDKPQGYTDWHWHEEIQFSYVLDGEMIMTSQGEDHLLGAGSGIFINSNCAHTTHPASEDSARYLSLNIHPSLLTLFHGSVVEQKYFLPYVNDPKMQVVVFTPDDDLSSLLLDELRRLLFLLQEKGFGYELEVYGCLLHLWRSLLLYTEGHASSPAQVERQEAHDILTYIHSNYAGPITLEDIAEAVHLSRGECCRLFKAAYGCSIFTHILNYRINQSIPLLISTNCSLSTIAENCGFNSHSYYSKNFKEKVGISPLQYRKEHWQGSREEETAAEN